MPTARGSSERIADCKQLSRGLPTASSFERIADGCMLQLLATRCRYWRNEPPAALLRLLAFRDLRRFQLFAPSPKTAITAP